MFAQTPANRSPEEPFIILSSVQSTNNYAMAKLHADMLGKGTCLLALEQTAGKGQRGKEWTSAAGSNITMSTVFQVNAAGSDVSGIHPFIFSAAMALGCYDFIKAAGIQEITVKWPNDVYIGDRKAAGILIENVYLGNQWHWAVVGTGINLNQTEFGTVSHKAISMKQAGGRFYPLIPSGRSLHRHLLFRYAQFQHRHAREILEEYNSVLYKKGMEVRLKKDSAVFSTRIRGVNLAGELVTRDTMERNFTVGEIVFL